MSDYKEYEAKYDSSSNSVTIREKGAPSQSAIDLVRSIDASREYERVASAKAAEARKVKAECIACCCIVDDDGLRIHDEGNEAFDAVNGNQYRDNNECIANGENIEISDAEFSQIIDYIKKHWLSCDSKKILKVYTDDVTMIEIEVPFYEVKYNYNGKRQKYAFSTYATKALWSKSTIYSKFKSKKFSYKKMAKTIVKRIDYVNAQLQLNNLAELSYEEANEIREGIILILLRSKRKSKNSDKYSTKVINYINTQLRLNNIKELSSNEESNLYQKLLNARY